MIDTTAITSLIADQFPDFYREQGPNFVAFVQAYYQWMQEDNIIDVSRKLPQYVDIDQTTTDFLDHFKQQYMNDLPVELIGNQKLFQKHILELYRSKGSVAGLKLLFRLLYNDDVDVYIPSYDILKGSDGVWKLPKYLEVTQTEKLALFHGKIVTGISSGATAMVESVQSKMLEDRTVHVLYLSNIFGTFSVGEQVTADGVTIDYAPRIIGSPATATALTSSAGFAVGDVIVDQDDKSEKVAAVVRQTYDSTGIIDFQIVNGGDYYSLDAEVTITAGTNTTGTGADFRVFSISNTSNFTYNTDILAPYANTALNALAYGMPFNPAANSATILDVALEFTTILVGTIDRLTVTNPGSGYDGSVTVSVVDPYTSTRGIWTGDGFSGLNAVVTGTSLTGVGLISELQIYDSGFRYNMDGSQLTLRGEANSSLETTITYGLGAVGVSRGYFDDSRGFLSDDKYLADGYYYQDYSYVVKTSHALEQYVDILRKTVHAAGNMVFGLIILRSANPTELTEVSSTLTQV